MTSPPPEHPGSAGVTSLFDLLDDTDPTLQDDSAPVHTWTVEELHRTLNRLLSEHFPEQVWVEGEIRNLNRSRNGHVYFDLVDMDRADDSYPPTLAVTLFDRDRQVVNRFLRQQGGNVRINDGVRVRIRGRLNVFASRSTLQLRMTAIDPRFTLGVLEAMRQAVLAALGADGLLERNAGMLLTAIPSRIALITSLGSAAHADAMHELEAAAVGIEIFLFDAVVQGQRAGASISRALRAADSHGVDLILLVRGGGARTDLAAFDLEVVARAIALCRVPVFTGVGHEVDTSIADSVAHSSFKTPTAAASAVCELIHRALIQIDDHWADIESLSRGRLERTRLRAAAIASALERSCSRRLHRSEGEIANLVHGIAFSSHIRLEALRAEIEDHRRRSLHASRRGLEVTTHRLDALDARAKAHDPRLALARGWSISRNEDGSVIRSSADVRPGAVISTEFADGTVESIVESISARSTSERD